MNASNQASAVTSRQEQIASAYENPDIEVRESSLRNLAHQFANEGDAASALAAASLIDEQSRYSLVHDLGRPFAESVNAAALKTLLTAIPIMAMRDSSYAYYARGLAQAGYADQAVELTASIQTDKTKEEVIEEICSILCKAGDFDKAKEIALGRPTVEEKEGALWTICIEMAYFDKFKEAEELALTITQHDVRQGCLTILYQIARDWSKAIDFAKTVKDSKSRKHLIAQIEGAQASKEPSAMTLSV